METLLQAVQRHTEAANAERVKAGYPAMQLVGWAQPPSYDAASHSLVWARELMHARTARPWLALPLKTRRFSLPIGTFSTCDLLNKNGANGWGGRIRTYEMPGSKPGALGLLATPHH